MFGASSWIVYFCINFTLLAQVVGFHFLLEKLSRFHISYIVWGYHSSCRLSTLRVSHFEILVLLVNFLLRFWHKVRIMAEINRI